jgi:hypothetical protein
MNRVLSFVAAMFVAVPLLAQTDLERVLLPVLTPPVHGANGSEFHTELRIANNGELDGICTVICTAPPPIVIAIYTLAPGQESQPGDLLLNGSPGRFIYVPEDQVDSLSMNLRVFDVTHDAQNFGTEMPIVRENEFAINRISLVGVPTDARFRNTLRIYSDFAADALVTVGNQPPVRIRLERSGDGGLFPGLFPGFPDISVPAYGVFTDFPVGTSPVRVTIEAQSDFLSLLPIEIPVWAFVTVTNNTTQAITTITPHP